MTLEECLHRFGRHDFGVSSHRLPVYSPVTFDYSVPNAPTPARYWEIFYCKRCRFEHQEAVGFTPARSGGDEPHSFDCPSLESGPCDCSASAASSKAISLPGTR